MAEVSVCMIVKNEAAVLARCLDSLADIPDELIIVDTGSTDATPDIARRYTPHVYSFAWVDDFSAARNFSLQQATKEYIYTADADEVLDAENLARFRLLKAALVSEVEMVEMAYANQLSFNTTSNFDVEYRPKLFRRLRAFQFMDPIHEILRTEPIVFRSDVVIHHCPTGDHGGRDLALLARHANGGAAFSDRLEMMYARELLIAGTKEDFLAAQPYFAARLQEGGHAHDAMRRAACVLARLAVLQHDAALLLRVAAPELAGIPPCEICCALGSYYLDEQDYALAMEWFEAALSGAAPELVAAAAGKEPLLGLSACYAGLGDTKNAMHYRQKAEAWQPDNLQGAPEL